MSFFDDVIAKDKRFHSTDAVHDRALLEPVTRGKVDAIIQEAKDLGVNLMAWETYRSTERQELLFQQGATKLKTVGVHHYGLACDLVKSINGQPSWKGDFSIVLKLARKYQLICGADWGTPKVKHTFIDPGHVQRCSLRRQKALFAGKWYPEETYDPYKDL